MTEAPASLTYSSVVSCESIRIAFTVAALNDLDDLVADIGNAYLNADCHDIVYTIAGPEFGSTTGRHIVVTSALFGLKSSGTGCKECAFSKHNDRLNHYIFAL